MKLRRSIILVILMIFSVGIFAQAVLEAVAETDKTKANLGDVIRYTLTVKRQGELSQSPAIALPAFEGFRVGGSYTNSMINYINGAASATNQQIIDLIAVKSGENIIAPAKIRFLNSATKQYENIETKAITIVIGQGKRSSATAVVVQTPVPTAPPAEQDIRSIKYSYHFDISEILPYLLLLVALLIAGYFVWKKYFAKKVIESKSIPVEDHRKVALRNIKKARELLKKAEAKEYYSELYEIIRDFLSKHFNNTFNELTSQEIIKKLGTLKVHASDVKSILAFMKESDLVKYADYKPTKEEIEEIEIQAEALVNKIV